MSAAVLQYMQAARLQPKELAKTLKASLEEAKKQNLVVDYKILLGNAAGLRHPDNGGIEEHGRAG